ASLDLTNEVHDTVPVPPRYGPALAQAPVSQSDVGPGFKDWPGSGSASGDTVRDLASGSPRWLSVTEHSLGRSPRAWSPARDLLERHPDAFQFVTEGEADGPASLRFGDGVNGIRPASGSRFSVLYRVGNGSAGNVAAGAIAHVAIDDDRITRVSNPLPASG